MKVCKSSLIDYDNTDVMIKLCFLKIFEDTKINERVSEIKYLLPILYMYFLIVVTRQLCASTIYKSLVHIF